MKRILFSFFCLISIHLNIEVYAQDTVTLNGRIQDKDGDPVLSATVVLESVTTSQKYGTITDASGIFEIDKIPKGNYVLSLRCIGYVSKSQKLKMETNRSLSPITMEEDVRILSEVVVVSSHTRVKPTGEISVRLQGNPIAQGKSLMDVLRYIRGVEVFNNNILVNGKEGTHIYLGDRKISLQEFQSIPPSMIKNIEVFPNAGVSFGKDATGGVIKITLRDERGVLGSLGLSAQVDKHGFIEGLISSAVQYQKGKYTFYNNLKTGLGSYRNRYERKDVFSSLTTMKEVDIEKKERAIIDNAGIKYQITPKQDISFYGGAYWVWNDMEQLNKTDGVRSLETQVDKGFYELNAGLFYKLRLSAGKESSFTAKIEYLKQKSSEDNEYRLSREDKGHLTQKLGYLEFEPRIDLNFSNGNQFRAGFLLNQLRDNNRMDGIGNPLLHEIKAQDFKIAGEDYSPWVEFSKLIGQKIYLQSGLRYQTTNMRYRDRLYPDADYSVTHSGIYPNLQLQYMINPKRQSGFSLAYRRDFSLPNYGYYSPIAIYQTEHLYSIGNRKLRQEKYNIVELNYYIDRRWTITYRLRSGKDVIHIMTHQDESNPLLFYTRPENAGSLLQNYLSLSYTHRPFAGWNTNNRLFVKNNNESMPNRKVHNTSFGWSSTQQFRLKKNMGFTFSFAGETAQKRLSYETGAVYGVDAGAYVTLFDSRMYINFSMTNLLHSKNELITRSSNVEMHRIDLSPRTRLKLSISWNFSSGDKIKRSQGGIVKSPHRENPIL
ncbi:TonB-dependent receptor [Porphyromonas macacae]|uniref:TonB-dependent receptor n=1 Tax=Porphyromonas macacae TaxID=28115 RepID=UPI0006915123|nr:TonB-dependent receptor [Porphyromonas macacae]